MTRLAWLALGAVGVAGFSTPGCPGLTKAGGGGVRPFSAGRSSAQVALRMGTGDMDDEQKEAMLRSCPGRPSGSCLRGTIC